MRISDWSSDVCSSDLRVFNYINSLNAEQVEAEIFPVLFATGMTGQGDLTFKRSPNTLNTLPAGAKIDKISTNGNATLGMNFANAQKLNMEDNTGVNNIVAGSSSETTLGATVILKEAALNRLIKPRNSLSQAIENDACVFFSYLEQQQSVPRKFTFSNEDEVQAFMTINPNFHHQLDDIEFDDTEGTPIPSRISVLSSERVPMSFDYSKSHLEESDFNEQNINEMGDRKFVFPKSQLLSDVRSLDSPDKLGYDQVLFKVDASSMLIPSLEIQKQQAATLFPVVQQSIQIIYAAAVQFPEQGMALLRAFETFLTSQNYNIYDFIPKDQYDAIMSGQLQPSTPQGVPAQAQPGQPGAMPPVDATQMMNEMRATNPMSGAMSASVGRAAAGNQRQPNQETQLG